MELRRCGRGGLFQRSTPAAAPPAGNNVAAASSAVGSSTATQGSATKKIDVCAALSAATVSQIVGTTFNKAKASSVEGVVFDCEYDGPDSALLQINVDTQAGTDRFNVDRSAMKTVGHPPTLVSGVGDEALSMPRSQRERGLSWCGKFRQLWGRLWRDLHQDRRPDLCHLCPGQADRRGPARQALTRTLRTSGWLARCLVDLPGVSGQLQRLDELLLGEQFVSFDALERT
jgi:hypothetical protein